MTFVWFVCIIRIRIAIILSYLWDYVTWATLLWIIFLGDSSLIQKHIKSLTILKN